MRRHLRRAVSIILISFPFFTSLAFAAEAPKTINQVFGNFTAFNILLFAPALIAVGFVTLLAGIVGFVGAGDNEEKRQSGIKVMSFGIVVLFLMMTFWGFVQFFSKSFLNKDIELNNYLPPLDSNNLQGNYNSGD